MTSIEHTGTERPVPPGLREGLRAPSSSARLRSALAAGTHPGAGLVDLLVERCAVETDFFVRDMLTWALTRHAPSDTVPRLLAEVRGGGAQARSQALHTLSKIGDARGWGALTSTVLRDPDDAVARSAWRAAVALVPPGHVSELARELGTQLGRGDLETRRSLSRAIAALGEAARPVLRERASEEDEEVRAHAVATERLLDDPDADVGAAVAEARRGAALAAAPRVPEVPDDEPAGPPDAVPAGAAPDAGGR